MTYEERKSMSEEEKNKRNMWKEEMDKMIQALKEWVDLYYPDHARYTG